MNVCFLALYKYCSTEFTPGTQERVYERTDEFRAYVEYIVRPGNAELLHVHFPMNKQSIEKLRMMVRTPAYFMFLVRPSIFQMLTGLAMTTVNLPTIASVPFRQDFVDPMVSSALRKQGINVGANISL